MDALDEHLERFQADYVAAHGEHYEAMGRV